MAQMPPAVAVDQVVSVEVQIARRALRAAAGSRTAAGAADADPDAGLIVQVVPKANLELAGEGRVEVPVPAVGAEPAALYFDVRGTDAGPGELWVVARQGSVPLMTLTLTPEVTAGATDPAARPVRARGRSADAAPEAGWEPMLAITEEERGGARVYRFTLQAPQLGAYDQFTSERITGDRQEYVAGLYRRIEERWLSSGEDERAFAQELRAFGYELLMELFPEDLRAWLWKHRTALRGVMVTSTEPFIPWELVHLASPRGRGLPRETAFLGQAGLVRWRYGGWPATDLRLRPGRARHIVPDYPTEELALDDVAREGDFLSRTLGSSAVAADSASVRRLLARGSRLDLIHFAGHGEADGGDIGGAALLLEGRMEEGRYIEDRLLAGTVRAHARLEGKAGGPIVVLNACQVGRRGPTLTGIGGFADAFLEAGARAFVSSLWSVGDVQAHAFAESLYAGLIAGGSLAEATTSARAAARRRGDAAWLAYVVYGHPNARVVEEDRAALAAAADAGG
ncbi:MAG: CHAT domain-containing protein [Miltoncostaeaceae bacterium]